MGLLLLKIAFVSFFLFGFSSSQYADVISNPIIKTKYGDVIGSRRTHTTGDVYDEFLGIPFGAPPVGAERWQRPLPPTAWSNAHNATWWGSHCEQIISPFYAFLGGTDKTGEDCLHMNIWVPRNTNINESIPVMIYVVGGAFIIGSGAMYPGQELAVTGKVIVVNFNYRVGPIGWLSTDDVNAPGNYGLWDTRAALLWVRDNIQAFGGDPKRVTLFGHSSGGAITSHSIISPMTKGLFQRAISISGTSSSTFAYVKETTKMATDLGLTMLCPIWTNKGMVDCLKKKSSINIDLNGYISSIVLGGTLPFWSPVHDDAFIPKVPRVVWQEQGVGSHVDYLIGSTHDEGAGFVFLNPLGVPGGNFNIAANKDVLEVILKFIFNSHKNSTKVVEILKEYFPDIAGEDALKRTQAISQIMTELLFTTPAYFEAKAHAKNAAQTGKTTYFYSYKYRQSFQGYPAWVNGSHIDDAWLLFGQPFLKRIRNMIGEPSDTDKLVGANIIKYYSNFAYTGNPNNGPHNIPIEWPKFDEQENYLEQSSEMTVKKITDRFRKAYKFWFETWPKLIEDGKSSPTGKSKNGLIRGISKITTHLRKYAHHLQSLMKVANRSARDRI